MIDTIQTVGTFQPIPEVREEKGTVFLYRVLTCRTTRNKKLVSYETYTSKKERTLLMIQMRVKNDTFNKTGYYFLLKPDDKN